MLVAAVESESLSGRKGSEPEMIHRSVTSVWLAWIGGLMERGRRVAFRCVAC